MIRNFADANAAMRTFYNQPGSNSYTLDRMRELMAFLGNPQDRLKIVHVAGTSGKTSTAYYISALLEASGATVGLTVGPHVDEVNERVQINHAPLPEHAFCTALDGFLIMVHRSGIKPSYFELLVAFAYWQFACIGVDYAVVEVGLGGLLDGTNVITREDKVCVITDIGYDHTNILGKTLSAIAAQKAGIIQPQNEVFMHQQLTEVMDIVQKTCQTKHAELHVVGAYQTSPIESLPLFQQRNFTLAEHTVRYVLQRDGAALLSSKQLQTAANTFIPGRMEVHHIGSKVVIFDGAHNAQKMEALVESVKKSYPDAEVAALTAFVKSTPDRWQPTVQVLAALCQYIVVSSFIIDPESSVKESVPAEDVADYIRHLQSVSVSIEPQLTKACKALLLQPEPILLVTGSLYMLSGARQLLGFAAKAA